MSTIKERPHAGAFLLSEANGTRSRELIIVSSGSGILNAGTVLAKITGANTASATANAGNTGNGTVTGAAVTSEAVTGVYALSITKAVANAGDFEVRTPAGDLLGKGKVGTAFAVGGLSFTLGDGSTDFAKGDGFSFTVKASQGEWTAYDDDGTDDGRRAAGAILFSAVDATDTDVQAVGIVRDAEVVERALIGLDGPGRADLAALGIIIRP
ncbi:head decoration protein [Pseudomonas solani]|uniref:head decoration protein n=1 Tax=Pseudomonas solani TaxID=2731552 RepID=UPI0035BE3C43